LIGFGGVMAFVVLDSMLGDIIDYDTLHTGKRPEGVYTVAETNLQQYVEIIGFVLPALVMGATGFENNGGCTCGCGVACPASYLRWHCPGDIGYTCTGTGGDSPPLYGDATRLAPCTLQSSEGTVWSLRVFIFALPAVCALVLLCATKRYSLSRKAHAKIIEATEALDAGQEATDPLTGAKIERKSHTPQALLREHFTPSELASEGNLQLRLMLRIILWAVLFVGIAIAMAVTPGEAQEYVVTIGALICSALFVLLPWDLARLRSARMLVAQAVEPQSH